MDFKIISSKDFDTNGVKGTSYRVGFKGRNFGVSSLAFENGELSTKDGVLSIKGDVCLKEHTYPDLETGELRSGYNIMLTTGIPISKP